MSRREGASGPTATFFTSESFEEAGAKADMVAALGAIGIQRPSFIQAAALKASIVVFATSPSGSGCR